MLSAPAADSPGSALALLAEILDAVEDELSGVPNDPDNWRNDQRIYPPRPDAARAVPGHPRITRFRSRRHNTYVGENGAIEIVALDGGIELRKAGLDGRGVWELDRSELPEGSPG